jgi:hypothetical protein
MQNEARFSCPDGKDGKLEDRLGDFIRVNKLERFASPYSVCVQTGRSRRQSSSIGPSRTRFVALPSPRPVWTQRRRYREKQAALIKLPSETEMAHHYPKAVLKLVLIALSSRPDDLVTTGSEKTGNITDRIAILVFLSLGEAGVPTN